MNPVSIILIILIAVIFILALHNSIKKKRFTRCAGCSGNCEHCTAHHT